MKKYITDIQKLFIILIVIFLANSCKMTQENPTDNIVNMNNSFIHFVNGRDTLTMNALIISDKYDKNKEFATTSLNQKIFDEFFQNFKTGIAFNCEHVKIYAFVLYISNKISINQSYSFGSIKGISLFYLKEQKLFQKLFVKNEETRCFEEVDDLYCEVNGIITNFTEYTLNKFIPQLTFRPRTAMTFINEGIVKNTKTNSNINNFLIKAKLYSKKLKYGDNYFLQDINRKGNPKASCGPGCPEGSYQEGFYCAYYYGNNYVCEPILSLDPCSRDNFYNSLISNQYLPISQKDTVTIALESSLLYDFRDSILTKSFIGQSYISYYYTLSRYINDSLTIPIWLQYQTALTLFDFRSSIMMLLDSIHYGNFTFITYTQRDEIINILNQYESLTTNQFILDIIEDIKSDIQLLTNLTINQVLLILEASNTP